MCWVIRSNITVEEEMILCAGANEEHSNIVETTILERMITIHNFTHRNPQQYLDKNGGYKTDAIFRVLVRRDSL